MTTANDSLEGYLHKSVLDSRDGIVRHLRSIADDIEHLGIRKDMKDLYPDYVGLGREIIDKINWGVANLGIGGLLLRAIEADRVIREPKEDN